MIICVYTVFFLLYAFLPMIYSLNGLAQVMAVLLAFSAPIPMTLIIAAFIYL